MQLKNLLLLCVPALVFGACKAPSDFNKSADPRADFYEYVNGGWIKNNPIPAEESSWEAFHEIEKRNREIIRNIVMDAARDPSAPEGSVRRKIGDFWASAMDEGRIEAEGVKPLQKDLQRIAGIKNIEQLQSEFTRHQRYYTFVPFGVAAEPDFKNAKRVIGVIFQGGLGLPDRDYYTRTDDTSKETRDKYVAHMARLLQLTGDNEHDARSAAAAVLDIETQLAEASMTNVEMRDPNAIYNLMKVDQLQSLTPRWNWTRFFSEIGAGAIEEVNVAQPKFLTKLNDMLGNVSIDHWKQYLRWHVVSSSAPALSAAFVQEDFEFNGKVLTGAQAMKPRWRRALAALQSSMGEALGQEYVKIAFTPQAKARAVKMVQDLIAAFGERIKSRDWMSEATKTAALAKLHAIMPKIGYPDKWRDYSKLTIHRGATYLDNLKSAAEFEFRRNMDKIGKPVDRTEWGMSPQEVNAYYNPLVNEIVFPAGILQPPFFDESVDDATNYGAMGAIIGHELTHGFDDSGSQFDADGNLKDWWQPKDREEFVRRAAAVEAQFNEFKVFNDLNVNGKLTLGENIADLGGLTIAYHAFRHSLQGKPEPAPIDGHTADQRFFISYARSWRGNARDEYLRLLVQTNPHSPPRFRAMGPLQNLPEFAKAFGCKEGDPMVRPAAKRAEIW
jgi:predicted metalloendopeptidase